MLNDFKKHSILGVLDKYWQEGEAKTGGGREIPEFGRSLTVNEISKRTNINLQKVEALCNSLVTTHYLKMIHYDKDGKAHRYVITFLGQAAYSDWYYPKEIAKGFASFLTTFVAVASLLWNVFSSQILKDHNLRLQQLEKKVLEYTVKK